MARCLGLLLSALTLLAGADPIDNLVHDEGYQTAPLGSLGKVLELGEGERSIILVSGFGFGAESLLPLAEELAEDWRVLAVTPAGFGGTAAPPMPPVGTSYGDQTWTGGLVTGLLDLIAERRLRRPILAGHLGPASQAVLRLAHRHPDRVAGVVFLAGEVARPLVPGQAVEPAERRRAVDGMWAPSWFRTVSRETWNDGMWPAEVYSRSVVRGRELWQEMVRVPIAVMVRYLCEFLAGDLTAELAELRVPALAVVPGWSEGFADHPSRGNADLFFVDSWRSPPLGVEVETLPGSHLFLGDDQPRGLVDRLDRFWRSVTQSGTGAESRGEP
ncbi:MAG: alpha/beta hydrolase [Acidobacteriota bacterium]